MENNQQNSIDWLIEQIKQGIDPEDGSISINWIYDGTIIKAKEMYNKEMVETYKAGYDDFMYNLFDESEKEYSNRVSLEEAFKDLDSE
jgi:hypothetical protein